MIGKLQTVIDTISDGWAAFIHSNGLVESSIKDGQGGIMIIGGSNQFRYTALAYCIDKFAINFRNESRYKYNTGITKMLDLNNK